eukprot:4636517-Prymnesium_polylepis.1
MAWQSSQMAASKSSWRAVVAEVGAARRAARAGSMESRSSLVDGVSRRAIEKSSFWFFAAGNEA